MHTDSRRGASLVRQHRLLLATAACGIAGTLAVLLFPAVRFAYPSTEFHIALETAAGLTAALAALLFFGRLRLSPGSTSWLLIYALVVSAAVNLCLSVVPTFVDSPRLARFSEWSAVGGRLVAAAAFASAAFARPAPRVSLPTVGRSIAAAAAATVGVVAALVWVALPALPSVVTPGPASTPSMLSAHPVLLFLQLAALLMYTAAAIGFFRRAEATGDVLLRWLAAGSMLAAFSRLHYALYPSLYSEWVYSGDFLRLGFYGLLLAGAVGEIRRYWLGVAEAAAVEERRRLARDLHDGVAQELAYIASQSRLLSSSGQAPEMARRLEGAADRALDESRRAIAALTRAGEEPLDIALAQATQEVAQRVGAQVRLDLHPGAHVAPAAREGLIRIAREAVSNAGRHSHADEVEVSLAVNGRVELRVTDHGVGFDPRQAAGDRFGLVSMRERAEALDADFQIISSPGQGTSVEVIL